LLVNGCKGVEGGLEIVINFAIGSVMKYSLAVVKI
jgi:hypothetical protein